MSQTGQVTCIAANIWRTLATTCRSPQQRQPQAASMRPEPTATANMMAMVGPQASEKIRKNGISNKKFKELLAISQGKIRRVLLTLAKTGIAIT